MNKIFLALSTLFAVVHGFSSTPKMAPNVLPTPLSVIDFDGSDFSGTNGFTVTKTGTGFAPDSTYENGFHISDKTSYLEINPGESTAIAGEHGFSVGLYLSNKAGESTDNFEQLFTIESTGGKTAHICIAGLYYVASSSASVTYSFANGNSHLTQDATEKYHIYTIDYDEGIINDYVNGILVNQFTPSNNKAEVIASVIDTFKELQTEGKSLFIRKPCSKKSGRNTQSMIAANISIYNSVITADEAAQIFIEKSSKERTDLPITVASCDDYSLTSVGYGVVSYASDRPNSFNINNQTSYLSFKAAEDKKLTQNDHGFSLSFYHKSTTDTFYTGNTDLRPNVTDDFEQLLTVEDGTGVTAHICTGGMYYSENGTDYVYATPRPNDVDTLHVLLTTEWKYVTINVDTVNDSVVIYVNGEARQHYDQTHPTRAAMIKNVVSMFKNAVSSLGGEVFLRKPFALRVNRNSATNIFDEMVFDEYKTDYQIKALHDSKLGKIRVTFLPNVDVAFPDIVGEDSITIPSYEGSLEGYTYKGYYFDEEHTDPVPDDYVTTESITIYPYFELIRYTITYHLDDGVNNENNPTEYTTDQRITLYDAYKEGYVFAGWYRTEQFENKVTILVEGTLGDIDLYAKFERQVYKITYVLNGGLFTEEPIETFTIDDSEIALPNAWKPELSFLGWFADERYTQKVNSIDPTCGHDVTLYACFAKIYTITYVLDGGLLDPGAIETYTIYDGIINLPSAHKDGFTFEGWYTDAALTNKVTSLDSSFGGDITLYAKFVEASIEPEPEVPTEKRNYGLIIGLSVTVGVLLIGLEAFVVVMLRRKKS